MDRSLLSLLCVSLSLLGYHASSCSPGKTYTLLHNVLVVCVNTSATSHTTVQLQCGEAYGNGMVRWREGGQWLDEGNRIEVSVEEEIGGNYSCHNEKGKYLNHTLLLVEELNGLVILDKITMLDKDADGYIQCSANSYRGAFQCSWKRTSTRTDAAMVLFRAKRGRKDLTCTVDSNGSEVSCVEPGSSCGGYSEETERIHLHLYMLSHFKLEHYSKIFYLRDIVRPDPVPVTPSEGGVFQWAYPPTWDKPCSFFPLEFQGKVIQQSESCDSTSETLPTHPAMNYTVKTSPKPYWFCLRARDYLTNGPWSDWTKEETK